MADNVLDELKKLDAKRAKLIADATAAALAKAEEAVAELNALGHHYTLSEGSAPKPRATRAPTGTRRTGIREQLLDLIKSKPEGMSRAQVLDALGAKGKKNEEQSISNALANLKKSGTLALVDGTYKAPA